MKGGTDRPFFIGSHLGNFVVCSIVATDTGAVINYCGVTL